MHMQYSRLALALMIATSGLLGGCGGGGDDGQSDILGGETGPTDFLADALDTNEDVEDGSDSGAGSDEDVDRSGVSYYPLVHLHSTTEFSGLDQDLFVSPNQDPWIEVYVINPIDAETLAPVSTAAVSDFVTTVDEIAIDTQESEPTLQKMVGVDFLQRTALMFDLSGSVTNTSPDIPALVAEAKAFVDAARASTDPMINSQEFVVWAFAGGVTLVNDLVDGGAVDGVADAFTAAEDAFTMAALDEVANIYQSQALGNSSNLHRAVTQAIGRYRDAETDPDFDFGADGNNDLTDYVSADAGVGIGQLVLFSTGPDTARDLSLEVMEQAIGWQSLIRYNEAAGIEANETAMLEKSVLYYVLGGADTAGEIYTPLSEKAEATVPLSLSNGGYTFASDLIARQQAARDNRFDTDNMYVYRFAFLPRYGDHTILFESNTDGFNYALTTEIVGDDVDYSDPVPALAMDTYSRVEISGPNGEFIAGGTIDLDEASVFTASTRFIGRTFPGSDYQWDLIAGTATLTPDPADGGRVSVSGIPVGTSAVIQLTNNAISAAQKTALLMISN